MGLLANPRGDRDRDRCRVISRSTRLISGCCNDGCLIFSNSCFIFMTWLWIGTPLFPSSSLISPLFLVLLLSSSSFSYLLPIFFCSIFIFQIASASRLRPAIPCFYLESLNSRVYIYGANNEIMIILNNKLKKNMVSLSVWGKGNWWGKGYVTFSTCIHLKRV